MYHTLLNTTVSLGLCFPMTVEFLRTIKPGETLTAEYVGDSKQGFIFRRDVIVLDTDGQIVLRGAIFLGVLDIKTRKLLRSGPLMDKLKAKEGPGLFMSVSKVSYDVQQFQEVHTRRIYPSWLDELGHVNNRRYGEMAYDAMTPERRRDLGEIARYEIYFMHELHADDVVSIRRKEVSDGVDIVGVSDNEGFDSFLVRCRFRNTPVSRRT